VGSDGTSIMKTSFQADPDFFDCVFTFAISPRDMLAIIYLSPSLAFKV